MASKECRCAICDALVIVEARTTADPECPEMLRAPPNVWVGFMAGVDEPEEDGVEEPWVKMIVTCSESCLSRLLQEH